MNLVNIKSTGSSSVVLSSAASTPIDNDAPINDQQTTTSSNNVVEEPEAKRRGQGPDTLLPADSIVSWKRSEPVKLRLGDKGVSAEKPFSVITLVRNTVKKFPNVNAFAVKRNGQWVKTTYRQYLDNIWQAAKSFIKLGLEEYHGVGIVGFNSPEWFISDLGAIFAGGFAVGIYTTNSAEACHFVADNSQCNILVVENDQQLQKILKVRDRLPHLKAIIQYNGNPKESYPDVLSWQQFLDVGKDLPDSAVEGRIANMAPNKACLLIYTSGTTGNPKGVMLSHDNITWTAKVIANSVTSVELAGKEHIISYLPLSHIAAQMIDIYVPFIIGATVWFAQPDALKGSLGETLKEVRPTAFFGVPRVWEKMQEKMVAIGKQNTGMRKKIASWARGVGLKGNLAIMNGRSPPVTFSIANKIVFKKVKAALGLDRCKICLTGAAPITRDTLEFFLSLNIPLMELYGMSESSGPHTVNLPGKHHLLSVGQELPGVLTKLDNPDKDGNGEICMAGRHVFMGYLENEEKTKETLDSEGWLHTGDIGKKDKDGFLYITGRIKELLITAGGENVAPVPIEDNVKEELPIVSNCMLIGDKKKFLSLLITLKTEVNPDTAMPTDKLTRPAVEWCQSVGSNARSLSDILDNQDENVLKAIQAGIDAANKRAPSRAQVIQKWSILPRDFSIPGGELGPTLKLKRSVVLKMYEKTVNAFYGEA